MHKTEALHLLRIQPTDEKTVRELDAECPSGHKGGWAHRYAAFRNAFVYDGHGGDPFFIVAKFAAPRDAMRLAQTCRVFARVLASQPDRVYSAFSPQALGRHGPWTALRERWARSGATSVEVSEALMGAAIGGRPALIEWIIVQIHPAHSLATLAMQSINRALIALIDTRSPTSRAFLGWFLQKCRLKPNSWAIEQAFELACERGFLGLAQVAYFAALPTFTPARAREALRAALEKAGGAAPGGRLGHVAEWLQGELLTTRTTCGAEHAQEAPVACWAHAAGTAPAPGAICNAAARTAGFENDFENDFGNGFEDGFEGDFEDDFA
jgi:hypothetical protein